MFYESLDFNPPLSHQRATRALLTRSPAPPSEEANDMRKMPLWDTLLKPFRSARVREFRRELRATRPARLRCEPLAIALLYGGRHSDEIVVAARAVEDERGAVNRSQEADEVASLIMLS